MESTKRKLVFGLSAVFALTAITVGIIGMITAYDGPNNLGVLASLAALVSVWFTLIYTRLRRNMGQGRQ